MSHPRNLNWKITKLPNGFYTSEDAHLMTLLDIREELRRLNLLLNCHNFVNIPKKLDAIKKNTAKRKRKKNENHSHVLPERS